MYIYIIYIYIIYIYKYISEKIDFFNKKNFLYFSKKAIFISRKM